MTDYISRADAIEAVENNSYGMGSRASEYTDFSLGDGLPYCRWVVREGNDTPYWAMTTCKRGFNPLTKVRHVKDIKKVYDGCYCPICGRPIKTSGYVFDDDFVEREVEE